MTAIERQSEEEKKILPGLEKAYHTECKWYLVQKIIFESV